MYLIAFESINILVIYYQLQLLFYLLLLAFEYYIKFTQRKNLLYKTDLCY